MKCVENKNHYHLNQVSMDTTPNNLVNLHPGEEATIRSIHADEGLHHRLTALGFRIGKRIALIRRANFSGPLHVRVGSTDIILRQSEARRIFISDQHS
jgi:ferrous iron transport protein A